MAFPSRNALTTPALHLSLMGRCQERGARVVPFTLRGRSDKSNIMSLRGEALQSRVLLREPWRHFEAKAHSNRQERHTCPGGRC